MYNYFMYAACLKSSLVHIWLLDILFALSTLGFDPYVEPLKLYLTKYRESIKGDKSLDQDGLDGEMVLSQGPIQTTQGQIVQLADNQHVIIQDMPTDQQQYIFKQE